MSEIASGKALVLSVRKADTVRDLKRRYAQQAGIPEHAMHITFREGVMDDDDPLHKHGIESGQLSLVFLNPESEHDTEETDSAQLYILAAAATSYDGETITIESDKSDYRDLSFGTIRLSCESDPCTSSAKNYAGFILYGCRDNEKGEMKDDWYLNGKHCKSAYLVVQDTDSPGVQACMKAGAPGMVHGAVYWNVFGRGRDVKKAVGEGFSLMNGTYKWNSYTFNANSDAYHDKRKEISGLAKRCVRNILDDWQRTSALGKTYIVKDLLAK